MADSYGETLHYEPDPFGRVDPRTYAPKVFMTFVKYAVIFFFVGMLSSWVQRKNKESEREEYANGLKRN